jgi:hypothetical protein
MLTFHFEFEYTEKSFDVKLKLSSGGLFMENFGGLNFKKFEENDVEIFTQIMKRAFDKDTQIHLNEEEGGPDGYDNGDFLKKWYLHKDVTSFAVYKDSKPIGAIAVWIRDDNINYLGNTFVDPELQDKAIGLIVWKYIEQKFPETIIWKTDAPGFSARNHNFYVNKCGFKVYEIENPKDKRGSSYKLEKIMKSIEKQKTST